MSFPCVPKAASRFARACGRSLVFCLGALSFNIAQAEATDRGTPLPRETREIEGIAFEFSPPHEALVTALAPKIAALNAEPAAPVAKEASTEADAMAGLSIVHFREARNQYLAAIAKLSGQPAATELQEACYDEVLRLSDKAHSEFERAGEQVRHAEQVKRVLIWDRAELIRRLKAGEAIVGFTLGADGQGGNFEWGVTLDPEPGSGSEATPKKVLGDIRCNLVNGRLVLTGEINAPAMTPPTSAPSPPKPKATTPYVIVLDDADAKLSPEELVNKTFEKTIRGMRSYVQNYATQVEQAKIDGATLAFMLLKETARIGLNERLGPRSELRWLSEGGARYIAWRALQERHPPEAALAAYDIRAHLTRVADRRGQVSFATWKPIPEKGDSSVVQLDDAHRAYATMTFFVMAQRFGPDAIPRFFAELARTPPQKLSSKTAEKAFQKTTGKNLNQLLADVLKPSAKSKGPR